MQAIILAGGFGTRLRSVVAEVPKPMAPLHDKPFLAHLINYLKAEGITSLVLSVHYMREKIQDYFQSSYAGIPIRYSVEETALGTGGAIIQSLKLIDSTQPVFIVNGDTFLKVNFKEMYVQHDKSQALLTMALRQVDDCSRYGVLITDKERAVEFKEQGGNYPGLINGGLYLLSQKLFDAYSLPPIFSFERDFLFKEIPHIKPHIFKANSYFIDIGVPEDYAKAITDFS